MPLQIRRGNTAEINAITPLVGEIIYNTQTGSLHVGNGTDNGGVVVTSYNDNQAKDATAEAIADGTHSGITFTYDSLNKTISSEINSTINVDITGSVFSDDSTLLIDGEAGVVRCNVESTTGLSTFAAVSILNNTYDNTTSVFTVSQAHSTADARNVSFARSRGTYSNPTPVITGDDLAELVFVGYGGSRYAIGGRITCTVEDTNIGDYSMRSRLDFATDNGFGTSVARVTIDSTGLLKALYGFTNNTISIDNNKISTIVSNADIELDPSGTGTVDFVVAEQTTVGAAGGASALPATPTKYFKIKVNGVSYVVPAYAVS